MTGPRISVPKQVELSVTHVPENLTAVASAAAVEFEEVFGVPWKESWKTALRQHLEAVEPGLKEEREAKRLLLDLQRIITRAKEVVEGKLRAEGNEVPPYLFDCSHDRFGIRIADGNEDVGGIKIDNLRDLATETLVEFVDGNCGVLLRFLRQVGDYPPYEDPPSSERTLLVELLLVPAIFRNHRTAGHLMELGDALLNGSASPRSGVALNARQLTLIGILAGIELESKLLKEKNIGPGILLNEERKNYTKTRKRVIERLPKQSPLLLDELGYLLPPISPWPPK